MEDAANHVYDHAGILPVGLKYDGALIDPELSDGEFILQWIQPISDDPLTLSAIRQAKQEFDVLFPGTDERDRMHLIAGMGLVATWWAAMSATIREHHAAAADNDPAADPPCPDCGGFHDIFISLDEADSTMGHWVMRLATTIFGVEDDPDLDDAFADLIEGLARYEEDDDGSDD